MNASSQNPRGGMPPELSPVRPALPEEAQATFAAYGVVLPAPAGSPATTPEDATDAPAPVTTLQAAAAVLDATRAETEGATSQELAAAEERAGILFDAASIEDAADAAREQARAEYAAELTEVHGQLALMAGARRQVDAVLRLCEGRRGDDLLLVAAVATAAEAGTTALDGLPMKLTWKRSARVPDAHDAHKQVVIECTSSYGGLADLVVEGDDRLALASLVDAEVRDVNAQCPTDGCGTVDDYDVSDPALFGWARLEVAGVEGGPRWYCTPMCVSNALARAGGELASLDHGDDLDVRYGPGASDEYALQVAEATEAGFEDERGDDGDGA